MAHVVYPPDEGLVREQAHCPFQLIVVDQLRTAAVDPPAPATVKLVLWLVEIIGFGVFVFPLGLILFEFFSAHFWGFDLCVFGTHVGV